VGSMVVAGIVAKLVLDPSQFAKGLDTAMSDAYKARKKMDEDLGKAFGNLLKSVPGKDLGRRIGEQVTSGLTSAMNGLSANVGTMLAGGVVAGAAAIAGALSYATYSVLGLADRMSNLADRTGMGTEALQKFAFAGSAVGVSAEQIGLAMTKINRGIGSGSKATATALRDIGLGLQDVAKLQPDQQFSKIMGALDKIPNAANKAQAAIALFGPRLGPSLAALSGSMEEAMKKAVEFGAVISEKDVAAADQLGDNLGFLKLGFEGLINTIGTTITSNASLHAMIEGLGPILGTISKAVLDNRAAMQEWVSLGVELAMSALIGMVGAVRILDDVLVALRVTWLSMLNVAGSLSVALLRVAQASALAHGDINSSRQMEQSVAMVKEWQAELSDSANKLIDSSAKRQNFYAGVEKQLEGLKKKTSDLSGKEVDVKIKPKVDPEASKKLAEALAKEQKEWEKAMASLLPGMGAERAGREKASDARQQILGPGYDEVRTEVGRIAQAITDMGGAGALTASQFKKLGDELERLRQANPEAFADAAAAFQTNVTPGGLYDTSMGPALPQPEAVTGQGVNLNALSVASTIDPKTTDYIIESVGNVVPKLEKAESATKDWQKALQATADIMQILGINADSALGQIIGGVTGLLAAIDAVKGSIGGIKDAFKSFSAPGGGGLGGIAKIAGSLMGGIGAALSAGKAALQIGKAIVGLFKSSPAEKAAKEGGKYLGFKMSKELSEQVAKDAKKFGVSMKDAILLNLNAAIAESGKSAKEFSSQIMDAMALAAKGGKEAGKAIEEVGKAFSSVREQAKKGVGDKAMVQLIQRARELGLKVPEIADAIKDDLAKALGGLGKVVSGIAFVDTGSVSRQATLLASTFWATVREQGIVEAAFAFADVMKTWNEKIDAAGLEMTAETAAMLAPINAVVGLAMNETTRAVMEGIQGLSDLLGGLADSGYMTVGAFQAVGGEAQAAYDQLIAGGADSQTALMAIAPLLAQLKEAAANYGVELDDNTKRLIEQAEAAGVAFPVDPLLQIVDVLKEIAKVLGAEIPASANRAGEALRGLPAPNMPGGGGFTDTGTAGSLPGYSAAAGLDPTVFKQDTVIRAHKGELGMIVPASRVGDIDASFGKGSAPIGGSSQSVAVGPTTVTIENDPTRTREGERRVMELQADTLVALLRQRDTRLMLALQEAGFARQ